MLFASSCLVKRQYLIPYIRLYLDLSAAYAVSLGLKKLFTTSSLSIVAHFVILNSSYVSGSDWYEGTTARGFMS